MNRLLERFRIRANRLVRRWQAERGMRQIDGRPIPEWKPGEVWMLVVGRNEALRLPYMLRYHFDRGISHVLFVDNDSTDGTLDLLLADPRITVFSSTETYKGPLYWQEPLLRRFARDRWCLVLDADELFAYPQMDTLSIPELASRLDASSDEALHCLFVEMFSRCKIGELAYRPGDDLLAAAPWFDTDGYVLKKYHPVFNGPAPTHIVMGGTRERMFPAEFGCSKYPFFKYHPRYFFRRGLHTVEGARISPAQGAVLHFKYLQDFREKAVREAARGLYWNASAEYKAYVERFQKDGDFTLWHEKAVRYESWRQLRDLGLLRDLPT